MEGLRKYERDTMKNKNLKNLTMTWAKDGKTLDFVFRTSAGRGRVVTIEGWVSRHFDSTKYGIESQACPRFNPKEGWDFFGPKENYYNTYYSGTTYDPDGIMGGTEDTNRFATIAEAVVEHFNEQWGIDFTEDEIREAIPVMTDAMEANFKKIVSDWAFNDLKDAGYKGDDTARRELADEIAADMVNDGTCFSEKGYMETTEFGLYNLDGDNVWNEVEYRLESEADAA